MFIRVPFVFRSVWCFRYDQFRPRQRPILSQNKAISGKDDCSILEFAVNGNQVANFHSFMTHFA